LLEKLKTPFSKIVASDDSAHKIALGTAVGMVVAWTPTLGFQMILAALAAWVARANKPAAILVVWITNPYTAIPIYWFNYKVGALLLHQGMEDKSNFVYTFEAVASGKALEDPILHFWEAFNSIAAPLWLGSMIVGLVIGVATFFTIRSFVNRYRSGKQDMGIGIQ